MTAKSEPQHSQKPTRFGPGDPHPLSAMKTELVWEGKYDEYGNRREVEVAGMAMPLQKIETVDEPRSRTEAQGLLFDTKTAHLDDFRNMLVWGDNKLVMASLLRDFRGKVDLVYIDPPFDVGADFTMNVGIGDEAEATEKDQSLLELIAYRDTWGRGTDSYLHMIYERMTLVKAMLSRRGSLYVHIGPQVNHMVRNLIDELFGQEYPHREIIWQRVASRSHGNYYPATHDAILFYAATPTPTWNQQYIPISDSLIQSHYTNIEEGTGRRYTLDNCLNQNPKRPNLRYEWNGHLRVWRWTKEKMQQLHDEGRIVHTSSGMPRYKRYLDESKGTQLQSVWTDIRPVNSQAAEDTGYDTQKPTALLERIVRTSSNEGDLVADFFCGSGTTGAVAERLGRRWIMADLGRFAIHTSRKRLIDLQRDLHEKGQPYRAFDVFNLGRYERQWWQKERLKGADEDHRRVVLEFYKAEPLTNSVSPLLHGRKGPSLCHVDGIDGILTRGEAQAVAAAAKEAGAKEVTCLAWEFEMDLRLECNRLEKELEIRIKLIQIPREIMEKNRTEPPPFLEVATLEAKPVFHKQGGKTSVDIKLVQFLPSLAEVPTKELQALQERAVKSGFDFIDFWAVDFDYRDGEPFHHHWQDYRTRKDRSLVTESEQRYVYPKKGTYHACVKVVDIFGCDTSITVPVKYD